MLKLNIDSYVKTPTKVQEHGRTNCLGKMKENIEKAILIGCSQARLGLVTFYVVDDTCGEKSSARNAPYRTTLH